MNTIEAGADLVVAALVKRFGSQEAAADELGVSQPTISRWLHSGEMPLPCRILAGKLLNRK